MKLNPYIAGNPVGGSEAFIGRKGVYDAVLRVLRSPNENGIVLYGQRRIGKTSVLLELEKSLPGSGPFSPVYFDLQDKAALPLEDVLKQLAEKILYDLDIPAPDELNGDFETGFKEVFLPWLLSQLPEKNAFVLLLDEFDVLSSSAKEKAGSTLFPYLRDLMAKDRTRINFIFVVGRRIEDLSNEYLSLFKGLNSRHVSLLSGEDTETLVRLSEQNESLKWEDASVKKVRELAGGHPFLTQQLCQSVWENIYDDEPDDLPVVTPDDVETAVPETLKSAANSLEWLWGGLGPAERVVASAIAEAGAKVITQAELEDLLQKSGVRILIGELQDAPRVLEDWDIIQPENKGYRFRVEMLRRWIVKQKPLARVQDDIDRVQPLAESLFQAAYNFYQNQQLKEAVPLLEQALSHNPNHLKANQLLGEIFIAEGNIDKALNILETLFASHPSAARPRLVQALLMKAQFEQDEYKKLGLLKKILDVDKNQKEALTEYQRIWINRGNAELDKDIDKAFEFYQRAFEDYQPDDYPAKIIKIALDKAEKEKDEDRQLAIYERIAELDAGQSEIIKLIKRMWEKRGDIAYKKNELEDALNAYEKAGDKDKSKEVRERININDKYHQAVGIIKSDPEKAKSLLAEVIAFAPDFKESSRYLHLAVTGEDIEREKAAFKVDIEKKQALFKKVVLSICIVFGIILSALVWWKKEPTVSLRIDTEPKGATVFINDMEKGTAPLELKELDTSAKKVLLKLEGFKKIEKSIQLQSGNNQYIVALTPLPSGEIVNSIDMEFVPIKKGKFMMGSPGDETGIEEDEIQHTVTLKDFYYIQITEVTQKQWQAVMDNNPSHFKDCSPDCPVENVSWNDVQEFIKKLNQEDKRYTYRLPTEAEWEYVCRAGTTTPFAFGKCLSTDQANYNGNKPLEGCPKGKYRKKTIPVASFEPNAWGVYDMHGNVWEWCQDWYGDYLTSDVTNPEGPEIGESRVLRGGSWFYNASLCRSANRSYNSPGYRYRNVGFRLVLLPRSVR